MSKPPTYDELLVALEQGREAWRLAYLEAQRQRRRFVTAAALAFGFLCSTILALVLLARGLP